MPKIILYIAQSLDGFIADKDGGVSWLDPYQSQELGYEKFVESIDVVIMGSKTYEQVLVFGEWPYKNMKSYIVTHRKLDLVPGEDIELWNRGIFELAQRTKLESKKNIWLIGGAQIVSQFQNETLIDEYMIFTVPTMLSQGIPLFLNLKSNFNLELIQTKSYKSGIVELHYKKNS